MADDQVTGKRARTDGVGVSDPPPAVEPVPAPYGAVGAPPAQPPPADPAAQYPQQQPPPQQPVPHQMPPAQPGYEQQPGVAYGAPPMRPAGPPDPLDDILGPLPAVKLRGLPFEATVGDVMVFFEGVALLDIVFVLKGDRPAGEAIVVLPSSAELQMALQRDRHHMGRRYVEVFPSSRTEYYLATATKMQSSGQLPPPPGMAMGMGMGGMPGGGYMGGGGGGYMGGGGGMRQEYGMGYRPPRPSGAMDPTAATGILRMRGLPFSAMPEDIAAFFQGYAFVPESIKLTKRFDGKATGEAFVAFSAPEESARAARDLDKRTIGSRYVELFHSTTDEAARARG